MAISIDEYKNKMENTLKIFHEELSRLRTGRATPSLLEPIFVEAYNSKMKISELATVNAPEPKLLTVQVWDKSMVQNVEKSIRDSELGLNPSTDGQLIRVPLPDLTEERRSELTKVASKFSEDAKISIRNIRRDAMDKIKDEQKNNLISEDEQKSSSDEIQKITDEQIKEIEKVIENKKNEIMQI
ncbi:MAG: ribosome recycling factor [Alphaproteobacteria bacterium]|nr:ribosome recycling factor [Alphaproteobacteria bacterium]